MKFSAFLRVLWLICAAGSGVWAQPQQYKFNRLDIGEGLSNSQVKAFFKDSRGFVWIGTVSGLNRFDGHAVKVFRNDPRDTTTLHDDDVIRLFEDPDGRLWIGTWTGPALYDPAGERFRRNTDAVLRSYGVPAGTIINIIRDSAGFFWFIHATEGLYRYDARTRQTRHIAHNAADSATVFSNLVAGMVEDSHGNFWLLHKGGVLEQLDGRTHRIAYRTHAYKKIIPEANGDYSITIDADDDLWMFAANYNRGIVYFNAQTRTLQVINKNTAPWKLNTDIVHGIVQDNQGLIWVGTDHGGINVLDKKKRTVSYILHAPEEAKSLAQNSINALYKDSEGFIWAGTFKRGACYFHENSIRFRLFRHLASDPASLPFNDINAFAEDRQGNLWIGTNGGGLIYYNRAANSFRQFLHQPSDPNSLSSNVIVSLLYDHDDKLWIGTYFGGLNCYDGRRFTRYKTDAANPQALGDNNVWEIFEDTRRNLWIGTHSTGMDRFDRDKKVFTHFRSADGGIHAAYVPEFMEDRAGNFWIGTGYGIDLWEKETGAKHHLINEPSNPRSLSNNVVMSMIEDSFGKVWIGTKEGLNLFDPKTKTFRSFGVPDGLPHNTILTIEEDLDKNLWMGTPNGLSNLVLTRDAHGEPLTFQFRNYDESDGLQSQQFNESAAMRTSRGELVFGGTNGFNLFRPGDIVLNDHKPKVVITGFQIFNKPVHIGEEVNGDVVLTQAITETQKIVLKHSDNVFSLEFASLSFFNPEKTRYRYKLEGFNKEWLEASEVQRRVTYTNLDPGDYVFKVMASNNDGIWNDTPTQLAITILPPFWKTRIAFALYVLVILLALLFSRRLIQERERMKFRIRQEQQLHELDLLKLKFFTNVSHEFRTPLTLILTPLEKILRNTTDAEQNKQFQLIYRNARRLLNLVNQLLDFRRLEVQEVKLNPSEGDIVAFVREAVYSFTDLSEKKSIALTFQSSVPALESVFDRDKLEKIIFNLLSNAFKFTPDHGKVGVVMDLVETTSPRQLRLQVTDTGIGIAPDKQEKIFERFFQSDLPKSMVNQGSGIGLSITKEFVRAHGGTIMVSSELNAGSCFTVLLPVQEIGAAVQSAAEGVAVSETVLEPALDEAGLDGERTRKPVLLLVEDNEDFRFYLKDNLKFHYRMLEAGDGKAGLRQAQEHLPDLIVSDVMMPEMNGIELCKKIKQEKITSHIPVILLTARTAEEQKMEGFDSGADDYVTKPFNFEILQSRIRNLIHQRELFQKDFRKPMEVRASTLAITSLDEKLIQNAIRYVEQSLSDPDFSVEDLSRELAMSRVHLYKKLQALTGKSPLEFIRSIRLQHAAQLLEKSQLTVSEVAYRVGFNNPKYFARYFKETYHVLPSAYASGKRG